MISIYIYMQQRDPSLNKVASYPRINSLWSWARRQTTTHSNISSLGKERPQTNANFLLEIWGRKKSKQYSWNWAVKNFLYWHVLLWSVDGHMPNKLPHFCLVQESVGNGYNFIWIPSKAFPVAHLFSSLLCVLWMLQHGFLGVIYMTGAPKHFLHHSTLLLGGASIFCILLSTSIGRFLYASLYSLSKASTNKKSIAWVRG